MTTTVSVGELIAEVEAHTSAASPVERVREAQTRAYTLAEAGEQLVGYFVSRAKEAGASWASIGEALGVTKQAAQQSSRSRFARYTQRARGVVVGAQEIARQQGNHFVGTEHLLLGILGEVEGLGAKVLAELAEADVEGATRVKLHPGEETAPPARVPFTPRAKRTLDRAAEVSTELGHGFVGTEHLLLGLFGTGGIADDVLAELGVEFTTVRERVQAELARLFTEHTEDLPSID
jgi:ClpA/ClpB-like protein